MQIPYLALLSGLLQDLEHNNAPFGAMRDLVTIINRTEHEGLSFLTIVLPSFFDDVLNAIEGGRIDSAAFPSFRKRNGLPVLFSGITSRMFDSTGNRKDLINPFDVQMLRQICYLFKKIKLDCTPARVEKAFEQFELTDEEVNSDQELPEDLQIVADYVISTIFPSAIDQSTYTPRPGPGAVFENLKGNAKYRCRTVAAAIEEYFGESCIHTSEEWCNADVRRIEKQRYPVTRITQVPKTLKAPRIIAIEPTWTMMYQQGIKEFLYSTIQSHWLTSGQVNFTDQSINQELARLSSLSKSLSTIDLSEASDRIGNNQVINFFRRNRFLLEALQATRTGEALLPSGKRIELKKFASMGSATCFPVESLVFFIATLTGVLRAEGVTPEPHWIRKYSKQVWTYGDDIISPSSAYSSILELFTTLGWKVNRRKSFYKDFFRESCGLDAYAGVNVTPTYLRSPLLPETARKPAGLMSILSTSNLMWEKHLVIASEFLSEFARKNTKSTWQIRQIGKDQDGIGSYNPIYPRGPVRFNKHLHRLEQKIICLRAIKSPDHLEGHPALFKSLTSTDLNDRKGERLELTSLRYANKVSHSWVECRS